MGIKKQAYSRLALNICILILINVLASMLFFRLDLTADKRHSLSDTSKDILKDLDDIVYVKVYLEGEFPAGFTRLQNATYQLLNEFRNYSSFLEYEFINPSESINQEERNRLYRQLYEQGLEPTNLQVQEKNGSSEQIIFPGAFKSKISKKRPDYSKLMSPNEIADIIFKNVKNYSSLNRKLFRHKAQIKHKKVPKHFLGGLQSIGALGLPYLTGLGAGAMRSGFGRAVAPVASRIKSGASNVAGQVSQILPNRPNIPNILKLIDQ